MKIGYFNFGLKAALSLLISFLPFKRLFYRFLGYKIGKGSRIGFCCLILCDNVTIGRYVEISPFVIIRTKKLELADYAWIGSFTLCYGWGSLVMGKFACVGMRVLLNAERNIFINDYVVVGQYSNVYTHSVALPYTRGYPRRFVDVEIKKNVRIGARTTLLPGVIIGENSWIGPNSLVNKDIPDNVFAGGVPAKVISEVGEIFDKIDAQERKRRINEMAMDFLHCYSITYRHQEGGIFLPKEKVFITDMAGFINNRYNYIILSFDEISVMSANISWFDFKNNRTMLNSKLSKNMNVFFRKHYGERMEIV